MTKCEIKILAGFLLQKKERKKGKYHRILSSASERQWGNGRVDVSTIIFGLYVSAMQTSDMPV